MNPAAGALLAAAALLAPLATSAQAFPSRPITITVSFPPGGATDSVARALAAGMTTGLKQSVVVQNVGGAGGSIGTATIANAPNNGYALGFIAAAALTTLPHLRTVPYRLDSFDYVCRTFDVPVFVLAAPNSRFKTLDDMLRYARENPGKLNYATVGPGSQPHLAALDLARAAGITFNHVPYKGESAAVTDLLGGHVDLYLGTSAVASTHNLRRLAVAAAKRTEESPDTPTLAELGYKVTWAIMGGVIAPKGMDPKALATLRRSCAEVVKTTEFKDALDRYKVRLAYADGAAFEKAIAAEAAGSSELLKSVGLLKSE
jgi:tripartite-type tricarboxylate transporter receptor subunit TctC